MRSSGRRISHDTWEGVRIRCFIASSSPAECELKALQGSYATKGKSCRCVAVQDEVQPVEAKG